MAGQSTASLYHVIGAHYRSQSETSLSPAQWPRQRGVRSGCPGPPFLPREDCAQREVNSEGSQAETECD